MKTLNTKTLLLITALSLAGIGCSKSGGGFDAGSPLTTSGIDGTVAPVIPTSPIVDGTSTVTSTPSFTITSVEEMNAYVNSTPLNNPTNIVLSMNMTQVGSTGRYSGQVSISYVDNGYQHNGVFTAPAGYNSNFESYGTARDVGLAEAQYNYWWNYNGHSVFSGYFQDNYGGLVVVIDRVYSSSNQGDGQGGNTMVSGQIWYRNFATSYAPQSVERKCWFIYAGPYDCRSNNVTNKAGVYPNDSYRKLGDFRDYPLSQVIQ